MNKIEPIEMPSMIGRYTVLRLLGSGGMGEVFLAHDPINRRDIAIKRMRSDQQDDPSRRELFLREAYLTAQLSHPAIITVYEIVASENQIYYTMPYIEGMMLKDVFALGCKQQEECIPPDYRTTVPALSHVFLEICYAVAYAHSKGILHRDLKPSNIMMGVYGQTVILDWGVAKEICKDRFPESSAETTLDNAEDRPEKNEVGKITGTLVYAAPELLVGEPASFRTEVYSLGLILYQMLTLRYPFHRSDLEEYRKNKESEILVNPAKIAPHRHISHVLSEIALKCLAPAPGDRYQSVEELMIDVENYLKAHLFWFRLPRLSINHLDEWENFCIANMYDGGSYVQKDSLIAYKYFLQS